MMKSRFCLSLLVGVLVWACSNEAIYTPQTYSGQRVDTAGNMCASVQLDYVSFSAHESLGAIDDSICAYVLFGQKDKEALLDYLYAAWQENMKEAEQHSLLPDEDHNEETAEGDISSALYCNAQVNCSYVSKDFISLVMTRQSNVAQYPLSELRYMTVSAADGTLLGAEDVFPDVGAMQEILTQALTSQQNMSADIALGIENVLTEADVLPMVDDFALGENGVTFCYRWNEILPYADGYSEVFVPYERIVNFRP